MAQPYRFAIEDKHFMFQGNNVVNDHLMFRILLVNGTMNFLWCAEEGITSDRVVYPSAPRCSEPTVLGMEPSALSSDKNQEAQKLPDDLYT